VDEALCYGWVDSRPRGIDGQRSARLVTPRKPASSWSARNKTRVEQLTAAGRMHPSGLAAVAAARANGAWTALDDVETLAEPPDLAAALDATPGARGHWDAFPRSARRAILEWITNAKTGATRQARVQRTADEPPATSAPTSGGNLKHTPATEPGKHPGHATDRSVRQPHRRHLPGRSAPSRRYGALFGGQFAPWFLVACDVARTASPAYVEFPFTCWDPQLAQPPGSQPGREVPDDH